MTQVSPLFRAMALGEKEEAVNALVKHLAEDKVQESNPITEWNAARQEVEKKRKAFQQAKKDSSSGWDEEAFLAYKRAQQDLARITGAIVSSQDELDAWSNETGVAQPALIRATVEMNRPEKTLLGRYERSPIGMFWLYSTSDPLQYARLQSNTDVLPFNDRKNYWAYNTPAAWDINEAKGVITEAYKYANSAQDRLEKANNDLSVNQASYDALITDQNDKLDDAKKALKERLEDIDEQVKTKRKDAEEQVDKAREALERAKKLAKEAAEEVQEKTDAVQNLASADEDLKNTAEKELQAAKDAKEDADRRVKELENDLQLEGDRRDTKLTEITREREEMLAGDDVARLKNAVEVQRMELEKLEQQRDAAIADAQKVVADAQGRVDLANRIRTTQ